MLYHHDPHRWPWGQGHGLWNFKLKFLVKFLEVYIFWSFSWILLILCLILDTGLKFYAVPSLPTSVTLRPVTLRSRSRTLKSYVKVFVKVFFYFLLWKQLRQICGWTQVSLVTLTCGSWSESQHDPYFTVHRFCLIAGRLFDVWTSHFGIMSQYDLMWPQNKCRSLWHISWSSDFALYLEDCLMYEHFALELWVSITRPLT